MKACRLERDIKSPQVAIPFYNLQIPRMNSILVILLALLNTHAYILVLEDRLMKQWQLVKYLISLAGIDRGKNYRIRF